MPHVFLSLTATLEVIYSSKHEKLIWALNVLAFFPEVPLASTVSLFGQASSVGRSPRFHDSEDEKLLQPPGSLQNEVLLEPHVGPHLEAWL